MQHIKRRISISLGRLWLLLGAIGRSAAERGPDVEVTAAMMLDELENWLMYKIVGVRPYPNPAQSLHHGGALQRNF